MEYDLAYRLTGALYGNILNRDSDELGFNFYLEQLQTDQAPLKTVIYKFFISDEFCEKFVVNQTPNELSKYLLISFFKQQAPDLREVNRIAKLIITEGLGHAIKTLINDPQFYDGHGDFGIPEYREVDVAEVFK